MQPRSRLVLAEQAIVQATQDGHAIVVLPAYFNTGISYTAELVERAETPDGETVSWMRRMARQHSITLVGALMTRLADGLVMRIVVATADGFLWTGEQQTPFFGEAALFDGRGWPLVAQTPAGRFGVVCGADSLHSSTWRAFAGQVDAVIWLDSLPRLGDGFVMAEERVDKLADDKPADGLTRCASLPLAMAALVRQQVWAAQMAQRQSDWLRVPLVTARLAGHIDSPVPAPLTTLSLCGAIQWGRLMHSTPASQPRLHAPMHDAADDSMADMAASHDIGSQALLHTIEITRNSATARPTQAALHDTSARPDAPRLRLDEALSLEILRRACRQVYLRRVRRYWGLIT